MSHLVLFVVMQRILSISRAGTFAPLALKSFLANKLHSAIKEPPFLGGSFILCSLLTVLNKDAYSYGFLSFDINNIRKAYVLLEPAKVPLTGNMLYTSDMSNSINMANFSGDIAMPQFIGENQAQFSTVGSESGGVNSFIYLRVPENVKVNEEHNVILGYVGGQSG
jgi:hypothetical protein